MTLRHLLTGALCVLLAITGCDGCDKETPEGGGDASASQGDAGWSADGGFSSIDEPPLTADALRPVIMAVGNKNELPERIDIAFAVPVIDDGPRPVGGNTVLQLEPQTAGSVRFTNNSTLTFEPAEGFLPSQTYSVRLVSVESTDGILELAEPWTYEFETPEFKFTSMSQATAEEGAKQFEVELYFSDAVSPREVEKRASWTVDGSRITKSFDVGYSAGSSPNTVRVYIRRKVSEGARIELELDAGIPAQRGESVAKAASASTFFTSGPRAEIYDIQGEEGPTGIFISTACRDRAAPGGTRYYYSRRLRQSFRVSRRCVPTLESAKKHITINPAVNFEVSPGRHGFTLQGDFKRGSYTIRIEPGLETIDGGVVRSAVEEKVIVPARAPRLTFTNKGRYLPRSAWTKLTLEHMNVRELELEIRHVPEKNLVFWMSGANEVFSDRVSNVVARDRVLLPGDEDRVNTTQLEVDDLVKDPKPGVYEVRVMGLGQQDAVRLLVTDMNLVVKQSQPRPEAPWSEEAYAWVIDMRTTKPIEGAKVDAIRPSGAVIGSCTTSENGGCRVAMPLEKLDKTPPFAFVASKADDVTYLKYEELLAKPLGDVSGESYLAETPYRAAIYSDRDLYRPAETAHIVGVLRKDASFRSPGRDVPVELTITDPRGNTVRTKVLRTNEAGVITHDEQFGDFATTGAYQATLKVAKRSVGTYRFSVEEFVPERMNVEVEATRKGWLMSEQPQFSIAAEYLFGGSAEDSPVEVSCRLEPTEFTPKGKGDYTFGPQVVLSSGALDLGQVEVTLDADGRAFAECPAHPQSDTMAGPSKLTATAAVLEAGSGRTTTDRTSALYHPEPYYVGLKTNAETASAGETFKVDGVVVDWEGSATREVDEVSVELIRLDYEYYWYGNNNDESAWGTNLRPIVESTFKTPVRDGKFSLNVSPGRNGEAYVIRVMHGRSVTDLRVKGSQRRYWWRDSRDTADRTPRPSRPSEVPVEGADEIEVGKKTDFTFEVPFKGRLLVTVETHRVITHEWHDVSPGPFKWNFMLGKYEPTVYVGAFLVKDPHLDSEKAFLPDRAYGVKQVRVRPTEMMHSVKLEAPKEVRPNSTFEVEIDMGGPIDEPTWVTVAAVDEGILSLTDMKTPKPSTQLFAKRALGVTTYETIGWAIQSDPSGVSAKTGGGDDWEEEEMATSGGLDRPMAIKPVALWSGLVRVKKDGKARVSFDVPTYRGSLRVMAVTTDPGKTGSVDTRVTVRDPLVLQTTLPRFMSGGDEIHIPVFVTNMTGAAGTVEVALTASEQALPGIAGFSSTTPIVNIKGGSTRTIELEKDASGTVVFSVRANKQAGVASFRVDAKLGKTTSFDEGIVPFRPNGPQERIVKRVALTSGANDLSGELEGWVPTSERSTIWVTSTPHGQAFDHLKYLIRYPYGCIEQTTSSTRPLLYISDLVELVDPASIAANGGVEKMVNYGLERALSMQTSSGGFGYWPGNQSPWPWATAYATHMLIDAKRQGFDVPQQRIDAALDYMEKQIGSVRGDRYDYRDADGYMSYVLALAGRGNKAQIQSLIERGTTKGAAGREAERRYMLKAALYLAGDRRYAGDLQSIDFDKIRGERESRWSYYSARRHRAFIFNIYQDTFEDGERADELATYIGNDLSQGTSRSYTTQELMWGITGLGKWTVKNAGAFEPPQLSLNGTAIKPTVAPKKRSDRSWSISRASEYDSVVVELEPIDKKVWAIISSAGVRNDSEPRIGGNGLTIAREFYNYEGKAIEPDGHSLGDLIYVEIKVTNTSGRELDNLALVDRFAGGFEVENPRLGRGLLPDWVDEDDLWAIDHLNVRDDRIETFGTLRGNESKTFIYAVRATSAGEFFAPPPEIDGMYEPEIWARSQPARVTVNGPWETYID